MRKIFRNIFISALALSAAVSCVDDRNNFMVDDSFGFNNAIDENVTELAIYGGTYELAVIKSGKGFSDATVFVGGSNAALIEYNEEKGTNYIGIPREYYSFSETSLCYKAEEVSKTLTVSWDIAKASAYMANEPENDYVIPVFLKSDDLEVNKGRHLVILNLKKSTVITEQRLLSWSVVYGDDVTPTTDEKNITVMLDRVPGKDLKLTLSVDESLVEANNAANGVNYALAPSGLFSFNNSLTLKNGELIAQLPATLNTAALIQNGTMPEFEGYVVPVRISAVSIEGVEYQTAITYLVVKGIAPVPPQLFERVWGYYTTSSTAPWYGSYLTAPATGGPDRNITMDDNYVYVAQSNGAEAKIIAYDLKTGAYVKAINISNAITNNGEGNQSHLVSCVRMVKNTDPSINGGKDILLASSLGVGIDFYLYAFENGIDQAPRAIRMESWRRLGDKFTVYGTWQSGKLFFIDNDAARNAVVYYNMTDGLVGESWGTMEHAQPAKYDLPVNVGLGEYTVHPQDETYALLNSATTATMLNGRAVKAWGNDPELTYTFGYNFFSSGVRNYIAYFKLDAETKAKGSLVVLNDATGSADFQAALEAQDVVFTAPIQDAMDASIISPIVSNPYLGDCAVREVNGTIYVAVLQNGGGLSLFKMNE